MPSSLDQLVEENAGDGTVRHPVSGITGCDPDVLIGARVFSDVRHVIDGLHDLTGPTVLDPLEHRETLARPLLEADESLIGVFGLAGLMVFAADDQHLVVQLPPRFILGGLEADVMVWIGSVPV